MDIRSKIVRAVFYQNASGTMPVRDWLKALPAEDRKEIGEDITAVEFTWPLGMPLVRPMKQGLWEVRSQLPSRRIARVLFCIVDAQMVLLHAFIKKSQQTPADDLALARKRQKEIEA